MPTISDHLQVQPSRKQSDPQPTSPRSGRSTETASTSSSTRSVTPTSSPASESRRRPTTAPSPSASRSECSRSETRPSTSWLPDRCWTISSAAAVTSTLARAARFRGPGRRPTQCGLRRRRSPASGPSFPSGPVSSSPRSLPRRLMQGQTRPACRPVRRSTRGQQRLPVNPRAEGLIPRPVLFLAAIQASGYQSQMQRG